MNLESSGQQSTTGRIGLQSLFSLVSGKKADIHTIEHQFLSVHLCHHDFIDSLTIFIHDFQLEIFDDYFIAYFWYTC